MIEEWWIDGTGGSMTSDSLKRPLKKGDIHRETVSAKQLTSLSADRRDKLMMESHSKRLVVLVLREVVFVDGKHLVLNAADTIREYFDVVGECQLFNK